MARCKRRPWMRTVNVPASPDTASLVIDREAVAFAMRARTAVGFTVHVRGNPADYFSVSAAETVSEDGMKLDQDVEYVLSAASAIVVEVWGWNA